MGGGSDVRIVDGALEIEISAERRMMVNVITETDIEGYAVVLREVEIG